ncbi:RNA exonuclease 4 [Pieris rapae]|uniref:RNA exonuclease 4 n=1 Tax=Pieris rapae TaxID=64459 RepID=UPI000B92DA8F|nr:RNA exonuclease 4 [Pieris rapae]
MPSYYAIDCEMVQNNLNQSMLARVSLVDEDLRVIMDEYVKPTHPVSDYRTWISGIQPGYERNAKPKSEVINRLGNIINGNVLVGFDIQKDLDALGITYPNVKDVATYQPLLKFGQKQSLKTLALNELGLNIQNGSHDSIEDARAVMKIYKRHRF